MTAFYAILDPSAKTLTYSRAGHNPPRLARGDQVLSLEEVGGLPMGLVEDQSFEEVTIPLETGDLLLLYTDGITEAMPATASAEVFGVGRLDALLTGCHSGSAEDCIDGVRKAVAEFCQGAPPGDDQTLIAVRVTG